MSFLTLTNQMIENLTYLKLKCQRVALESNFSQTEQRRLMTKALMLKGKAEDMDKYKAHGIKIPNFVLEDFNYSMRCIEDGIKDLDGYLAMKGALKKRESESPISSAKENRSPEQGRSYTVAMFGEVNVQRRGNPNGNPRASPSPRTPCIGHGHFPSPASSSGPFSVVSSPCCCPNCISGVVSPASVSWPSVGSDSVFQGSLSALICPVCGNPLMEHTESPGNSPAGGESSVSPISTSCSTPSYQRLLTPPWSVTSSDVMSQDSGVSVSGRSPFQ